MGIFERMERNLSRTVDRSFSRTFTCTPVLQSPNGRPIADPDKPAWQGRGIFDEVAEPAGIEIGDRDGTGNSLRSLVSGHEYQLSVDRHANPKAGDISQGDRIKLAGDSMLYRVIGIKRDGASRLVLALTRN